MRYEDMTRDMRGGEERGEERYDYMRYVWRGDKRHDVKRREC